jgi:hypothetical protein
MSYMTYAHSGEGGKAGDFSGGIEIGKGNRGVLVSTAKGNYLENLLIGCKIHLDKS